MRVQDIRALKDMTVGIVAYGRDWPRGSPAPCPVQVPRRVADPHVSAQHIRKDGFIPVMLDELLTQSDLVGSLHCPEHAGDAPDDKSSL